MEYLIYLAILPSIILGWYIYKNDKVEKEPFGLLFSFFLCGVASAFLTLFIGSFLDLIPFFNNEKSSNLIELFFAVFIGIALVEEFSKWLFVRLVGWQNKEFTHLYDGLVYSVFVALGFATFENILYVFQGGFIVALLRAVSAVPLHVFCGVFMGYYVGMAKQSATNGNKALENKNMFMSLLVPTLIHGFYDYCLMSGINLLVIVFFVFVIFIYIMAFTKVSKLSKIQVALDGTQQINIAQVNSSAVTPVVQNQTRALFCTECGTQTTTPFCPNCGYKI